jgi:hypothetical protein
MTLHRAALLPTSLPPLRLAATAAAVLLAACSTTPTPPASPAAGGATSPAPASAASPAAAPAAPSAPAAPAAKPSPNPAPSPAPAAAKPPTAAGPAGTATGPASAASAPGSRPPATAGAPPAAARPPAPGTPPPFAEVTREAKSTSGFLTVWTKDEKTWLEIAPERLDQPFFLGNSVAGGLGERFFLPGLQGREQIVVLRRAGNTVQLVARNLSVRTNPGTPLERAVGESYAESLLAAAPLASAPHPERKSLLVDAAALLGGDLLGVQTALESAYRLPYALDRANSHIERIRTTADGTFLTLRAHYAIPKIPAPPVLAAGAPPPPPGALPNPPRVVPDARSLLMAHTLTLAPLPATPMKARRADQRVGFFTDAFVDFTNDTNQVSRRTHLITRWRLEKKDPTAAISEPKEPIRVVLDRNIPERWRPAVRAGVLEWNRAFERAGFKDALAVEQQPADADWTTFEGTRLLAVRWFAMEGPGFVAVGPSQSDPRTGEILRAAAIIPENWVRGDRLEHTDLQLRAQPGAHEMLTGRPAGAIAPGEFAPRFAQCSFATDALEQMHFGLELLQQRGELAPDSPELARFIEDGLKAVVIHEVGHAIGLRHNFKASSGITLAQLRDRGFTGARGLSNSVMDYNPTNVPLEGEPVADYHMPRLGAYDLWAIEYGYREFAPADEARELAALAARGERERDLAYGPDEDLALVDPTITQFDLGDRPLVYAERLLKLSRELWQRGQKRALEPTDDYAVHRRTLQRGLSQVGRTVPLLARLVGGQYTSRSLAGSGQPLLTPVPGPEQRAALDLLLAEVFSSTSFRFDPAWLARLGFDRLDARSVDNPDFSLPSAVAGIQRSALDVLMSDLLATRLADAETRVADPKSRLSYADVQDRLSTTIWAELKPGPRAGADIDALRRTLQREHAKRLATGLLRPTPAVAADVRAVHRQVAQQLEADLRKALGARGWSPSARAHLGESLALLSEALKAPLVKQGA